MPKLQLKDWLKTDLQQNIYKNKYQHKDESFDDFLNRISFGDAIFKGLIAQKKFLPGGRILANLGTTDGGNKVTYSNCYVIAPPEDNIESIFDRAKEIARTFSYGGGVGVDLAKLAPAGAAVRNAAKNSSGAVSFTELYNMVTGLISQKGRRGALMMTMSVDHPDIEQFIDLKTNSDKITKANISMRVTDEFMRAVNDGGLYHVKFFRPETGEVIEKFIDAKGLFQKIAENNWQWAEPGVLFWDRVQNWSLLSNHPDFQYDGVNPCGEQPLPSYGSCLLVSINLAEFVERPFTDKAYFNFGELKAVVGAVVNYSNGVLDAGLPLHPLKEQQKTVADWRQIGIGVMGLADALIKLGIRYGSKEAQQLVEQIGHVMINKAARQSAGLAKEFGPYPKYRPDIFESCDFYNKILDSDTKKIIEKYGLRNSQLLTTAPTGSISTMLGVSGGIEPIFALQYTRKTESLHDTEKYYTVYTPIVEEYIKTVYGPEVWAEVASGRRKLNLPDYFVTAHDIHWRERVEMQAAWQKYVDASISSTINLPETVTPEEVAQLYMYAWEQGLKGVTVYRENCGRSGILTKTDKKTNKNPDQEQKHSQKTNQVAVVKPAPQVSDGRTVKLETGCGPIYLTMTKDGGELTQTFIARGSQGTCLANQTAVSRLISLALRAGVPVENVIDQLLSVPPCPSYCRAKYRGVKTAKGSSCPGAIAQAIADYAKVVKNMEVVTQPAGQSENLCPECGEVLTRHEGCQTCIVCWFSKCG